MSDATKDSLQHTIQIQSPPIRSQKKTTVAAGDATVTTRAPPLDIRITAEVIVVNGDRQSISWKRYTLIDINPRTGMCVVEGISDSRQRNFPRSVVKPKDWVDKLRALFHAMAAAPVEEDGAKEQKQQPPPPRQYVEYHNFFNAMQLMGAQYDHEHALKIFKALDVRANGLLSFRQWLNWVYGLGRVADKGRLLTTIECITGLRKWRNTLTYYVLQMDSSGSDDKEANQCVWSVAAYDKATSNPQSVHLIPMHVVTNAATLDIIIPKSLDSFCKEFNSVLLKVKESLIEVYSPSNQDARECSVVVMGPGEIGKSALINKFVKGIFPHDYDPTIQDHSRKQILVNGEPALLDILDTAGQDEFASMRYDWLRNSVDILLICFSRTDHESFIRAEELIHIAKRLLRQQKTPRIVPILLVATKLDLHDEVMCQVTDEDVNDLKKRYNAGISDFIEYEECSALMDNNVTQVFETAVTLYRKWRNGRADIEIKSLTERELAQRKRQDTYVQSMAQVGTRRRTKCVSCLAKFCPALAAIMEADDVSNNKLLNIASVPKDKFGDELAEPSYSKQHFFVQREVSCTRLLYCIVAAVFFPVVITLQTIYFVFYCECTQCCFQCFREDADLTDPQIAWLYDYLGAVVGRDPRETAKDDDARKWFLSQTAGQKFTRCWMTIAIDILFFFAFWNAFTVGMGWFGDKDTELSVLETLGPIELWVGMWVILSIYMSIDIDVKPTPPSMQCLRPYVMYLNPDESIRTTAYVFLRGFSKSTLAMFRLEATAERILTAFVIALVWIIVPGVVRVAFEADGGGKFFPDGLGREAIWSMITSFFLVYFLALGLQMQLMSGLEKYIEWMNDVTSMLDEGFSAKNNLHYINLVRHNNTLGWVEMRTYLYTKGLIIFSRQEIILLYVILLQCCTAMYILERLMSGTGLDNTYGSPSFVGILLMFFALTYSLLRILRTTRRIERLQGKQIALLAAQKFQIYYKRITWHPSKEMVEEQNELSEGNDAYDPDWADIDPRNLPRLRTVVLDDASDSDTEEQPESDPLLGRKLSSSDDPVSPDINELVPPNSSSDAIAFLSRNPTQLRLEKTMAAENYNAQNETMFSAEYLEQSEKFVQAVINICEAQDIIPRVFNIKIDIAVGLSVLCTAFAVIPTGARLIFGDDCADWN